MAERFTTLGSPAEGSYREKGSKFLAFAEPVRSKEEAEEKVESLRKAYPDASHHCFAYTVGVEDAEERENDDGEPSGTAGRPIMNAIRSFELQNLLVTVVRYFGGTKLGKRGLIDAYRAAAKDALRKGKKVEERVLEWMRIEHDHERTGTVETLIRKMNAEKRDPHYEGRVRFQIGIPPSRKEELLNELGHLDGVELEPIEN